MQFPLLGAHISTAGGAHRAFDRAREVGAECLQIFTRAPGRWAAKALVPEDVELFREARRRAWMPVIAHDIYLTNLAGPDETVRRRSLESLIDELRRCFLLGVDGLVCHLGAHNGAGVAEGLRRFAAGVSTALNETEDTPIPLLLESTAGQGSCLGHRFEQLAAVLELNGDHPRLGICLDTCHLFAAGYNLREEAGYRETWDEYDRWLDRERLRAFHLNDSKKPLGSRVDRHTHIGEGEIGAEGFRRLVTDPSLSSVPMFLETPDVQTMHRVNLERLRGYRKEPFESVRTLSRRAGAPGG